MKEEKILAFVKLVISAIQTDYRSQSESAKALIEVLENADSIHEELTGKRIVIRGHRTVLDTLVSHRLTRIPQINP